MIMKTIKYEHQSLSEIKFTKLITKGINENENFKYCFDCSQASSYIQSTLSNIIKSNNKFVDDNKILPNSLIDSFVDIAVDITHMSQIQRIAALVISTGLSIPLKHYGVNIRISVFGERNGVWTLSKDFSTDIETQLARLRDALTSKKRFMSFPADALYSLKKDWIKRFNNKNPDQRTSYTSVLISSLISPQVVDDKIDWSQDISNNIIVFGLKSEFDKTFMNEHKVYEELLKIPTTKSNSITQKFLEPKNVVGQSESERSLLEELCKSLVMSCFYNSGDKDNFKEYKVTFNNTKNNTVSEITSIKNISKFINNNMEDKTFTQSISHNMTDISRINEEFKPPNIPLPSTSEVWSHTQYNDMGSVGNFKNTVESILKTEFGLAFPLNTSSIKVPSSSGGTISIPALRKWIVSGFTYKEIFLKKGGKTKRKYSITFAIDLSSSIHLSCNYSHAIETILILLLGPATLQDNEEIKIDVIISTLNGPKIMFLSSKANTFESISCINSIINVIDNETPNYCMPGNTLNAAYQLQLQKGGVDIGKNIFFITDSYVTSRKEIKFANSIINSCEIAGIKLMTFGVGSYPSGIKQLYPKCCYAPSLIGLGDAIAFIYAISRYSPGSEIIPQVIMENTSDEIQNNLIKMINQPPENKELQESIENKHLDYIELLGNPETMTINEENLKLENKNPIIEPYYDGLFSGFNILVVILYLGGEVYQGKIRDRNVTINQFESGPGKALKRKGFNYKLVFSYGEAVDELAKSEGGRCPYIETWIFCSRGDGTLPKVAKDKDTNKIIPFLQCVTEFNNNGGGLLLFCDNEPFTFEANILLSEYLNFEDNNGNKVKPKFTMKGNYDQPDINKKYIKAMDPNNNNKSKNGKFKSETTLPSPGINDIRMSLRPGLIEFSEGKTLSYAECENGSEDYSPFTVFAYLTDTSKERPFILYYDPKMKDKEINQGPIVVHGGFTSAFYDFSYDGTGRLVTSIACWLVRYEERNLKQILNNMDIEMVKDVPAIPKPNYTGEKFTKFININNPNYANYSILILDISGSMVPYYESLINMANDIINNQLKNKNNKGVIIFFADSAKAVINGNYRTLTNNDIYSANVGGATNFHEAFTEAVKYINPPGIYNKRLLFLTDGESDSSRLKPLCNQISNAGFSIHILGFGDESLFSHLKQFARGNGTFQAYSNFINVYDSAIKIFTTEDDN